MASRTRIAFAFAAVYLIWGSTYLAIRYAIATLPPLLMAGARFTLAGGILYVIARARGAAPPERRHWTAALVTGGLLLVIGNGGVVIAERTVPSGLAALIVATVPLWMTLFESVRARRWPPVTRLVALFVGFAAVGLLADPAALGGQWFGIGLLVSSPAAWALGSLYSRTAPRPGSALLATGLQMLAGGGLLLLLGTGLGEWRLLEPNQISSTSLLAFGYLVTLGSLVGFTAYSWLLTVVSPTLAATYAYVNPVVAVLLGGLFAHEPIGPRTIVAAMAIIGSVVLITTRRER